MEKINVSRRQVLTALAGTAAWAALVKGANAQLIQQRPDPKTFQTGDIVWPKPPGAFVPYAGTPRDRSAVQAPELGEEKWDEMRIAYIRAARGDLPGMNEDTRAHRRRIADALETMTYTAFFHYYAAGVTPDEFQAFGSGQLAYVGHVAIVDVDPVTRVPYVVEAVYGQSLSCTSCVQRVPYADWLSTRGDILVWHGRIRNLSASKRAEVAVVAKQQLSKPYDFFNLDLLDDSGFYCSKLVWNSVKKATGLVIDGNANPRRLLWFSPLQAIQSKDSIELLSSPGNYRNI